MRILLITLLLFSASSPSLAQLRVFSCEPEWSALAHELGAGQLDIFTATTAQQDPHHIQPRPSLIAKARRADLLLCTGAELEAGWLPLLLRKAANSKIQAGQPGHFMTADQVKLLDKPSTLDRSQGDIHGQGNPHIHLSPHRVAQIAQTLSQRLQQLDKEHATDYQQAYQLFEQRWQRSIQNWEQQAKTIQGQSLIGYHNSWRYLADWLKLDISHHLEPRPGIPPSTEYLSQLVQTVRDIKPLAVIYASHQNSRAVHWLADKTGLKALALPYTVGSDEHSNSLFTLYDRIIDQLTGLVP